jgi:hypothetical protein
MDWAETILMALKESETSLVVYVPDISIHQVTKLIEEYLPVAPVEPEMTLYRFRQTFVG